MVTFTSRIFSRRKNRLSGTTVIVGVSACERLMAIPVCIYKYLSSVHCTLSACTSRVHTQSLAGSFIRFIARIFAEQMAPSCSLLALLLKAG